MVTFHPLLLEGVVSACEGVDLLIIELAVNSVLTVDQEAESSIRLEAGLGVLVDWVELASLRGSGKRWLLASTLSYFRLA